MLHFYRCEDCLSTITYPDCNLNADCVCGGILEYLGEVTQDNRAVESVEIPICDGRCTHAKGNSCRCQCGGTNHGTELLVMITYENGKAIVSPVDEKALTRATEYRAEKDAAEARIRANFGVVLDDYLASRWISDKALWWTIRTTWAKLLNVSSLRTHAGRIKSLRAL